MPGEQGFDGGPGDLHALRGAGGARGVEEIGQVRDGPCGAVGAVGAADAVGDPQSVLVEHRHGTGIGEDLRPTRRRVLPVEDDEGAVGPPHGQDRDGQRRALRQVEGDDRAFHTDPGQSCDQPGDLPVDVRRGEGDGGVVADEQGSVRGLPRALADSTAPESVDEVIEGRDDLRQRLTGAGLGDGRPEGGVPQPDIGQRAGAGEEGPDVLESLPGGHRGDAHRVGLETEVDATVGSRGDHEDEVLRRATGDIAQHTDGAVEVEGEVEGLEVQSDAVQHRRATGATQVTGQFGTGVALVGADGVEGGMGRSGDLLQGVRTCNGEAQRQHVHQHRRGASQRAGGPGHHRHRQQCLVPGEPELAQPGPVGRHDQVRPDQAGVLGTGAQAGHLPCGESHGRGDRGRARAVDVVLAASGGRSGREVVVPERAVGVLVRGGVGQVGLDDLGDRGEPGAPGGASPGQLGVVRGGATGEQGGAVSVDDDVVVQLHAPHATQPRVIGTQVEDQVTVQVTVGHGAPALPAGCLLRVHDRVGEDHRVRRAREVTDLRAGRRGVVDDLPGAVGGVGEVQPQGLGLVDGQPDSLGEQVDGALPVRAGGQTVEFQDLAHDVVGGGRVEELGVPDAALGGTEVEQGQDSDLSGLVRLS